MRALTQQMAILMHQQGVYFSSVNKEQRATNKLPSGTSYTHEKTTWKPAQAGSLPWLLASPVFPFPSDPWRTPRRSEASIYNQGWRLPTQAAGCSKQGVFAQMRNLLVVVDLQRRHTC